MEDIRLRLIEMGDLEGADALVPQIEQMEKCLEHHQHVLVAVLARLARAHDAIDGDTMGDPCRSRLHPAAPSGWQYRPLSWGAVDRTGDAP